MKKIKEIIHFLQNGIWSIRSIDLPKKKKFLVEQGRIILLTFKGFAKDKCVLRASSLTFFTLLSIVPVFAMAFGVAKSFDLQKMLEQQLRNAFEGMKGHEDILQRILEFSQNQLQNTKGGWIAGLGVLLLFYTIVKLLGNIENSFNDIWGIQTPRSFARKIADYLIVVVVAPLFMIISGSATTFISAQPEKFLNKLAQWELLPNQALNLFSEVFILTMQFLPLLILIPLFTFLYIFMPNTKVKLKAGLVAGTFAAVSFMLLQMLYVFIQVSLFTKYSAIYGSFAAIPMFLIWLEFSWMIVLFGAEISFASQNVDTCEFESESLNASLDFKRTMAVYITSIIVDKFENELPPPTTEEIKNELEIPSKIVQIILHELTQAEVLEIVKSDNEREEAYRPKIPDQKITVQLVLDRLDAVGAKEIPFRKTDKYEKVKESIEKLSSAAMNSKSNLHLGEI